MNVLENKVEKIPRKLNKKTKKKNIEEKIK